PVSEDRIPGLMPTNSTRTLGPITSLSGLSDVCGDARNEEFGIKNEEFVARRQSSTASHGHEFLILEFCFSTQQSAVHERRADRPGDRGSAEAHGCRRNRSQRETARLELRPARLIHDAPSVLRSERVRGCAYIPRRRARNHVCFSFPD